MENIGKAENACLERVYARRREIFEDVGKSSGKDGKSHLRALHERLKANIDEEKAILGGA